MQIVNLNRLFKDRAIADLRAEVNSQIKDMQDDEIMPDLINDPDDEGKNKVEDKMLKSNLDTKVDMDNEMSPLKPIIQLNNMPIHNVTDESQVLHTSYYLEKDRLMKEQTFYFPLDKTTTD